RIVVSGERRRDAGQEQHHTDHDAAIARQPPSSMSTAFVVLRAEVRLAGVGWNRKKNQRGGIPPRWSNDAGLVAGLFRLGRLLRPLGLVELVRLFDLLDLDDLLVCLRLAF